MKNNPSTDVELYVELKRETEAAYLFSDGINSFWLPKSQIIEMEHKKGEDYEIVIPEWLAAKKEII